MIYAIASLLLGAAAPVAPDGPWNVDGGETECTLGRFFEGERTLLIKPDPLGASATVFYITPAKGRARKGAVIEGETKIAHGDGGFEGELTAYDDADGQRVAKTVIGYADLRQAIADGQLDLDHGRDGQVSLALSGIKGAQQALDQCQSYLRERIGLADGWRAALASEPEVRDFGVIDADYPIRMVRERAVGDLPLLVWVDAEGRVEKCTPIRSSGYAEFDSVTCRRVEQRARFDPARDTDGNAVRAPYVMRVTFRITA